MVESVNRTVSGERPDVVLMVKLATGGITTGGRFTVITDDLVDDPALFDAINVTV